MKFSKDAAQERVAGLVRDMASDAAEHGVSLHMKSLMARNERLLEKTGAAFGEARTIAREEGIDLSLPEIVPQSDRRCDFIEEGCAFVSREGLVHPCHFLWHRFSCYLGGQANHVKPRVFGDLGHSGILEIWNDEAFRAFRENVLRYDFPFCYDCNFALCDLIQDENFIHDCYLAAVPCAGCLWCTRLFQCMR